MDPHGKVYPDTIEITNIHQQEEPLLGQDNSPIVHQPSRFQQLGQQFSKRNVKKQIYAWRWTILFFLVSLIMGCLMWTYRRQVFEGLETLSSALKGMGFK